MSIPGRIWRVIRGRWLLAEEQIDERLADEMAVQELAEALQASERQERALPPVSPSIHARRPTSGLPRPSRVDPLAADLALFGAPPACDLETLDRLLGERLAELDAETGTADGWTADERAVHRAALQEAYERLRDAINTTETRFEKLEF
jgi:hypothetical protein